ncbi:conserved hypothetical protein [Vibrio coralliirubri]|uniref:Heparinase n=1 Tax=Vibrio coralliirubri TaxID=1516159 RepID=A0AA86X3K6_9VIBR|nr:heparinase II/III family protein [Vibrio coralliirubri]CDU10771.1 conserved hypothetical protein [Vibrio coralliirubri]
MLNNALLYLNTVKHLKLKQIMFRLYYSIIKIKVKTFQEAPLRKMSSDWLSPQLLQQSYCGNNEFIFLNRKGSEDSIKNNKLWKYNLHYFDFLNVHEPKVPFEECERLIESWIVKNKHSKGDAWEPYPTSLRVVNWIKWFSSGNSPSKESLLSLFSQVDYLNRHIEYHLLGNHLFANAKALIFSGSYFSGSNASRWLDTGLEILDKEIPEQILDDGANFELSPMYHHIILADMLDLVNLAQTYDLAALTKRVDSWKIVISRMLTYGNKMTHPDGDVSFFNDSALGIAPRYADLHRYASELGIEIIQDSPRESINGLELRFFKDSGYIAIESDSTKAILDVAKVGPDYIPGHAHADTLSFELSLFGQRIFVNSGTGEYGASEERLRQRKTAAHNTVDVDDLDSSEVWSGFRVARRAYPSKPTITQNTDGINVSCSHDGFTRLPGKVVHNRTWHFGQNKILIKDTLEGRYQKAFAHYHIHPDVEVSKEGSQISLITPNGKVISVEASQQIEVLETTWHPQFGITVSNRKLLVPVVDGHVEVSIRF